ncbi:hypothetical protein [Streptomyces sp. NPDC090445]|uniref:hypothetical protein n=1 Tax=Streptomyces sp. NPDC090445 TaxID=3365963 RepID=UPI00382C12CA
MIDTSNIDVFLSLDVGKAEHRATAVTPAGKKTFDNRCPASGGRPGRAFFLSADLRQASSSQLRRHFSIFDQDPDAAAGKTRRLIVGVAPGPGRTHLPVHPRVAAGQ